MKTILLPLLVLLGPIAGPLFAETPHPAPAAPGLAVPVRRADVNGWIVSRGTPRQIILNHWGVPDLALSSDVWVFNRFYAVQHRRETRDCQLLVITFVDDRVADLQLVNARARAILASRLERGRTPMVRDQAKPEIAATLAHPAPEVLPSRARAEKRPPRDGLVP